MATLSPLRFHYDSEEFALPIRLGLVNATGTQDLIVNILAPNQRYEVANFPNVTIPTNLDVRAEREERVRELLRGLFDRTLEKNPSAVVTEYAWEATSCDPCPAARSPRSSCSRSAPTCSTPDAARARDRRDEPRQAHSQEQELVKRHQGSAACSA